MSDFETSKEKSNWGGARPGSGRPKGGENEATRERRKIREKIEERILLHADSILESQLSIARGVSYLFVTEDKGEGKDKRRETRRVTDPEEIRTYIDSLADPALATEIADNGHYYFITTERPDGKAIDSLFDRVFGKAVTRAEISGPDGESLVPSESELAARVAALLDIAGARRAGEAAQHENEMGAPAGKPDAGGR